MSVNITVRWGGPSDATSGSTYEVERSLDLSTWTELAAAQAATSPYASPTGALAETTAYGATAVNLADASSFSAAGHGWVEEALIQWTGKSVNQLTGVTWSSGYGSYAAATVVVEAHESLVDAGVTPTNYGAVYRITHMDGDGDESSPTYLWYFDPPTPASGDHCVVIVVAGADLGVTRRDGISVRCAMASDDQFGDLLGPHLGINALITENVQETNDLGIAVFHCWRNSARGDADGTDAAYTFTVDGTAFTVSTIPDRDWVLLGQVVTG